MKDVAKKRKRGFAIGESDDARKEDIRRREEKREAKEMENRINKVTLVRAPCLSPLECLQSIQTAESLCPSWFLTSPFPQSLVG